MVEEQFTLFMTEAFKWNWLENTYWISQILLLVIAGLAAGCGYRQLRTIELQRRATFLLELDRRFDEPTMAEARVLWSDLQDKAQEIVTDRAPRVNDGERMQQVQAEFTKILGQMREGDEEGYSKLMKILGFFETVGLMVRHGYVPLDDIDKLFRGPIIGIDVCFRDHIDGRQKEAGVPAGLYEHALFLSGTVRQRLG
ncbi:MAG: hypothetical protein WD341_06285 [Tistlia sp.]|uniref:DUF4760 domain-containing protein n=1 Tax=Tistlia sp. TaxID=3057121 RepID=UPI0034A49B7D